MTLGVEMERGACKSVGVAMDVLGKGREGGIWCGWGWSIRRWRIVKTGLPTQCIDGGCGESSDVGRLVGRVGGVVWLRHSERRWRGKA